MSLVWHRAQHRGVVEDLRVPRVAAERFQAWREVDEFPGRTLMLDGERVD